MEDVLEDENAEPVIPMVGVHISLSPIRQLNCQKCQHVWNPRKKVMPKVCPNCKSYQYHLAKKPNVGRPRKAVVESLSDETVPTAEDGTPQEEYSGTAAAIRQ